MKWSSAATLDRPKNARARRIRRARGDFGSRWGSDQPIASRRSWAICRRTARPRPMSYGSAEACAISSGPSCLRKGRAHVLGTSAGIPNHEWLRIKRDVLNGAIPPRYSHTHEVFNYLHAIEPLDAQCARISWASVGRTLIDVGQAPKGPKVGVRERAGPIPIGLGRQGPLRHRSDSAAQRAGPRPGAHCRAGPRLQGAPGPRKTRPICDAERPRNSSCRACASR